MSLQKTLELAYPLGQCVQLQAFEKNIKMPHTKTGSTAVLIYPHFAACRRLWAAARPCLCCLQETGWQHGRVQGAHLPPLCCLQETVGGSTAVSKELIYPHFDRLGEIHMLLSQELRLLVVRQRLFDELRELQVGGYTSLLVRRGRGAGV